MNANVNLRLCMYLFGCGYGLLLQAAAELKSWLPELLLNFSGRYTTPAVNTDDITRHS
jgi:hypothetical protein